MADDQKQAGAEVVGPGNSRRLNFDLRLSFPENIGRRIERMAQEREMSMSKLIVQLVEVGMISLQYETPRAEPWGSKGDVEYTLPDHDD